MHFSAGHGQGQAGPHSLGREELRSTLWSLAARCDDRGHPGATYAYLEAALPLIDTPSERAACLQVMGVARERQRDFQGAALTYQRAFQDPPEPTESWYFLHNNLAYCQLQLGQHLEAEGNCRAAIAIDPGRPNAHKNLGLALEGLGRHLEAAWSYLTATRARPEDPRALHHLEKLLAAHPELLANSQLSEQREQCRRLLPGLQARTF